MKSATAAMAFMIGVVLVGRSCAWEAINTSSYLFRGPYEEALHQLLEEEEQLVAPRLSTQALMNIYKWVAASSIIMCLLAMSVVVLGEARDAREYSERGLARAGLGRAKGTANPLAVKILTEVETERLVGLAREAWLVARGVLTRAPENLPAGRFL